MPDKTSDTTSEDLYPPQIFDPPQAEIDKILPHLAWPSRTLRVLGESVQGQGVIFDLGDGRVVKTGRAVSVNEAKAMIFVRTHTSIPVPQVYMVFKHDGLTHIVMEHIDGVDLRAAQRLGANGEWSLNGGMVTEEGMRSIVEHLYRIIEELRELGRRFPLKEPRFGSWPEGPFRNSHFSVDPPTSSYSTYADFHRYFLGRLEANYSNDSIYEDLQKFMEESPRDITPALSHGDLADRNVLVKDNRIVAIVDWETFGWYPDFWEVMSLWTSRMGPSLLDAVQTVFGKPNLEAYTYRFVTACFCQPF
ncbi:hypothetical protein BN946_scf184845.g38 [Trametes cinnabarina]|uniref:Aminoglycoside phosphotransferase domain-containing protein n=1 Tax=Pycnoporus cinnabarinus TaxID=5643 RepID=A0A060SFJ4_PYCCI|nr:hypothetical protein BN946_scf184845.g38 [Trametes cinnabarina]